MTSGFFGTGFRLPVGCGAVGSEVVGLPVGLPVNLPAACLALQLKGGDMR